MRSMLLFFILMVNLFAQDGAPHIPAGCPLVAKEVGYLGTYSAKFIGSVDVNGTLEVTKTLEDGVKYRLSPSNATREALPSFSVYRVEEIALSDPRGLLAQHFAPLLKESASIKRDVTLTLTNYTTNVECDTLWGNAEVTSLIH